MARISNWGKRYRAVSPENTSSGRSENPEISETIKITNGFNAQFAYVFAKTCGSERTVKTITKSE